MAQQVNFKGPTEMLKDHSLLFFAHSTFQKVSGQKSTQFWKSTFVMSQRALVLAASFCPLPNMGKVQHQASF